MTILLQKTVEWIWLTVQTIYFKVSFYHPILIRSKHLLNSICVKECSIISLYARLHFRWSMYERVCRSMQITWKRLFLGDFSLYCAFVSPVLFSLAAVNLSCIFYINKYVFFFPSFLSDQLEDKLQNFYFNGGHLFIFQWSTSAPLDTQATVS